MEEKIGDRLQDFSHADIKELAGFVNDIILDDPKVLKYLALRGARKFVAD